MDPLFYLTSSLGLKLMIDKAKITNKMLSISDTSIGAKVSAAITKAASAVEPVKSKTPKAKAMGATAVLI